MAGSNYGDILGNLVTPLSGASPLTMEQVEQQKATERKDINIYSKQFTPLAETDPGQLALKKLMGDTTADMTQRAAAFEVLNPGLRAGIGANGELTLSAAPGSDLGFKYPVFEQQSTQGRAAGQHMQQQNTLGNFEQQYKDIQAMTDPTQIAEAYSSMTTAAASLVESRRATLLNQVGQGLGLQDLETQMQADKVADQAYYNQYHRGQSMGPTDESMRTISLYNTARGRADAEVDRQLRSDPVLAGVESKMKILGMLVNSKLNKELSGEAQEKGAVVGLVGEESIKAVALARGLDYASMKLVDKQLIASQLLTGTNTATAQSRDLAMADSALVGAAAAGPAGDLTTQALRIMDSRTGDPAVTKKIIDTYKAFDTLIAPTLNKEQRESLRVPVTVTSAKDKAIAQTQINQLKMSMVMGTVKAQLDQGFAGNAQSWELPQDQELQGEVKAIRDSLLASGQETVSIDSIVQRMDWSGEANQQSKINRLAEYIQSQANQLPTNTFFGTPTMYANKDMATRYVQALAVKARVKTSTSAPWAQAPAFGIYN